MGGTRGDGAGAALMLLAQGTAMLVGVALVKGIGEHVVDEAQQRVEGSGRSLEHMFGSLRIGSDRSGVSQGILQAGRARRSPPRSRPRSRVLKSVVKGEVGAHARRSVPPEPDPE